MEDKVSAFMIDREETLNNEEALNDKEMLDNEETLDNRTGSELKN